MQPANDNQSPITDEMLVGRMLEELVAEAAAQAERMLAIVNKAKMEAFYATKH